ncbi:hypothetical protein FG002_022205 [Chitinimonas sp. BJB300]|nr:hypothetical protein FG002_022205 [Chitinimonas sp. BJB300]
MPTQIHMVAFIPACLCLLLPFFTTDIMPYTYFLVTLSYIGFIVGFLVWFKPSYYKIKERTIGKLAINITHAVAILISLIFARIQVADALGLPPQGFELTVSAVALIFYLPALAIIVSLLLLFGAMLSKLYGLYDRNQRNIKYYGNAIGALGLI